MHETYFRKEKLSRMAKNLVIIESPSKAHTIQACLGSNYKIVASKGHVRDLPKSTFAIDIENDFTLCKPLVKKSYTFVSPTLANYHIFNTIQSLAHFCHNM